MSQLSQIQNEILRRFRRPRTTEDEIPGWARGTLGDQLSRSRTVTSNPQSDQQDAVYENGSWQGVQAKRPRSAFAPPTASITPHPEDMEFGGMTPEQKAAMAARQQSQSVPQAATTQQIAPTGQVLTQRNQEAITRPRSVFAPPQQTEDPNAPFGTSGEPFRASRDRRTQPRDYVADDAQYLRELENKPRGWKDKAVDVLRVANQVYGSNPNIFTPTKREREELKARGMLGQDIAIQKEQTAREMAQMVPIYDASGNIIGTAPRRTAAGTQIHATDTGTRAAETKRRNDAYIADIERRPAKEQAEAARKIYASGVADGDEEFKADLAKRMGLTEKLPDSDKGVVQTDASGNFTIVHPRAATAETVTDKETGKPKQSWVITKEQRVDDRARRSQAAAMERTLVMAQATGARLGNPEDLDSIANEAQANADAATAKAQALSASTKPSDKKLAGEYLSEAGRHRAQAIKAREAASKARSGQNFGGGGTGANQGRGSFNLGAWKTDHPTATPDQIQAQRAKAKARNLSIVE